MIFKNMFRVIVLKVDVQICRERLLDCRHNVVTEIDPDCKLDVYSKDYKDVVEQDVIDILILLNIFHLKFIQIFCLNTKIKKKMLYIFKECYIKKENFIYYFLISRIQILNV